jgi:hypothetical protein
MENRCAFYSGRSDGGIVGARTALHPAVQRRKALTYVFAGVILAAPSTCWRAPARQPGLQRSEIRGMCYELKDHPAALEKLD